MKKEYDVLEMNVVCFDNEDIVTTSGTSSKNIMSLGLGENDILFKDLIS